MINLRSSAATLLLLCACAASNEDFTALDPRDDSPFGEGAASADIRPTLGAAHSALEVAAQLDANAQSGPLSAASLMDGDVTASMPCVGPPGLYRDDSCEQLAEGVRYYMPLFQLWSDGEVKERFVYLPPGSVIDTSSPDTWRYPVGTRLYKTFSRGSFRLETRMLEKMSDASGPDAWAFRTYAWDETQTQAVLVEDTGRNDVLGTSHDIPSVAQCRACHSAAGQDVVNGFSAILLNYETRGVSLRKLLSEGSIRPSNGRQLLMLARLPGDERAQAALGNLHANCGHCHGGEKPRAKLTLRTSVGETELSTSAVYRNLVNVPLSVWTGRSNRAGTIALRVSPGSTALSGLLRRMNVRGTKEQMPPLGTEQVDSAGVAAIADWIEHL